MKRRKPSGEDVLVLKITTCYYELSVCYDDHSDLQMTNTQLSVAVETSVASAHDFIKQLKQKNQRQGIIKVKLL